METSRCKLIVLQETDYEEIIKLYSDERVRNYLGGAIKDEQALRTKFQEDMKRTRDGSSSWVVRRCAEFFGN